MDENTVKDILGVDEEVLLLMGVGIGDKSRSRLEHHDNPNFRFPSLKKNITVQSV